ncbi:MAG: hypothetical protein LBP63_10980 [Prevotellaceae bacterium]|jgi:hypothetical protein|nr:hypothetical protein [Prevotellaceae bacterium]
MNEIGRLRKTAGFPHEYIVLAESSESIISLNHKLSSATSSICTGADKKSYKRYFFIT